MAIPRVASKYWANARTLKQAVVHIVVPVVPAAITKHTKHVGLVHEVQAV